MAKIKESKVSGRQVTYPKEDTPFVFFDEMSSISSNRDLVRFYLLRNQPSLNEDTSEMRSEAVAELGMGLRTFALFTLELHGVLRSMMSRGVFEDKEVEEFQEALQSAAIKTALQVGEGDGGEK